MKIQISEFFRRPVVRIAAEVADSAGQAAEANQAGVPGVDLINRQKVHEVLDEKGQVIKRLNVEETQKGKKVTIEIENPGIARTPAAQQAAEPGQAQPAQAPASAPAAQAPKAPVKLPAAAPAARAASTKVSKREVLAGSFPESFLKAMGI